MKFHHLNKTVGGRTNSVLSVTILFATLATSASAQLQNGSFENGINPPSYYRSLYTGDTSITDWSIVGRIDWSNNTGSPGWAEDGHLSAELVYDDSSISQTFGTTAGQSLSVSFYANYPATIDPGAPVDIGVTLTNNGSSTTSTVSLIPSQPVYTWNQYTVAFGPTAPGTTTSTISFTNLTGGYAGPFLDNVVVTPQAAPEPSALAGLGFGALGLLIGRRRRS